MEDNKSALDVSCIVLAGGKSTRLGRNKIFETIGHRSLLERVIFCLTSLQCEITVVIASESSLPQLTNHPELRFVKDIYPGKGTLGGIFTGLAESSTNYNLVVACDMPFLNLNLLRYIISLSEGYDVVIPKTKNILEPLHAVYSRNCLSTIETLLQKDKLSVLELYPLVKVKYVTEAEIDRFDPQHLSFFNVNTEADLKAGIELARKEDSDNDKC
jgi:molybdenum cofactor guanylyltransferase